MLFVKKLPWASLLLLVFAYGVFGWLISAASISWVIWLMGLAYTLLIALALTAPFELIKSFYFSWLQSDTRAFISIIVGAFVLVIIITWLEIFVRILVLISAAALVRLDLQTAGYTKWQAFGLLVISSLIGFGLGLWVQHLL
ncbi:MAG TPA: hypothetical protein V6D14_28085 [Coleofasciculaceae cyanobacterium]|jgi:hypothetical protein